MHYHFAVIFLYFRLFIVFWWADTVIVMQRGDKSKVLSHWKGLLISREKGVSIHHWTINLCRKLWAIHLRTDQQTTTELSTSGPASGTKSVPFYDLVNIPTRQWLPTVKRQKRHQIHLPVMNILSFCIKSSQKRIKRKHSRQKNRQLKRRQWPKNESSASNTLSSSQSKYKGSKND